MVDILGQASKQEKSFTTAGQANVVEARPRHIARPNPAPIAGFSLVASKKKNLLPKCMMVRLKEGKRKGLMIKDDVVANHVQVAARSLPKKKVRKEKMLFLSLPLRYPLSLMMV